jgi:hypothetical protein
MSNKIESSPDTAPLERAIRYPLIDALLNRRSRRFGRGMRLNGGPLAFQSELAPEPLTLEQQAALAFAACGVTGYALGELPYDDGGVPEAGSGNIIMHFAGRTVASGDAAHAVAIFVIDDGGAWMLKRPQDFPRAELPTLIEGAREHRLVELYERGRVRLATERVDVAREVPVTPPFNKWAVNTPGSTVFLPVAELTALALNIILAGFGEEYGYYVLDDRNGYRPAGLAKFARSRGGHLYDDPAKGRIATVSFAESLLWEFAAIEQGGMLQNLGLMAQALGLGGFPWFAAHPYAWQRALGFRMVELPFSRTIGAGPAVRLALRALGRDIAVPTAVGLEVNGAPLIKPFCPPYYRTMEDAVLAFVDYKCAEGRGTQHDGGAHTAWQDGAAVQAGIPRYSDRAIGAAIAYCEYLYQRYGRFPSGSGPFRTTLAYQAAQLDPAFYRRFYTGGA